MGEVTEGPQPMWSVPHELLIDMLNTVVAPLTTLPLVGDTVSWKLQPPLTGIGYEGSIPRTESASAATNNKRKPSLPRTVFLKLPTSP